MAFQLQRGFEVAKAFHGLGWTSFGGPIAHVAYFRTAFVVRRRWLGEHEYAELLALVQLLPGPSSTQMAVLLGIGRAGLVGGFLAWLAFVLPSALIMLALGLGVEHLSGLDGAGWLHGLKVVVVGVVAQAVVSMSRRLCPDWPRRLIAVLGALAALALAGVAGQLLAIALGGLIGSAYFRSSIGFDAGNPALHVVGRMTGIVCLALFALLLVALPALQAAAPGALPALADSFYRAGALVFGGGHVILPLLQAELVEPGLVSEELFLAGYGAAQALPGPLFTFAAYLGAVIPGPVPPVVMATFCLLALFLPSVLLVLGALPFWARLRRLSIMAGALAGVGAAVVGLLVAALIDPIWPSAIRGPGDVLLALIAFGLLSWGRLPPWLIVIGCAAAGEAMARFAA